MLTDEYESILEKEKKLLSQLCVTDIVNAVHIDLLLNIIEILVDRVNNEITHEEYKEQIENIALKNLHFKEISENWGEGNLRHKLIRSILNN